MKSTTKTPHKTLVTYWLDKFSPASVNWAQQMMLAKKLLERHTLAELMYAIDYFKNNGTDMYSLGYLTELKLKYPLSQYKAEQYSQEELNSGERNRMRIEQNNISEYRTDSVSYLFEES